MKTKKLFACLLAGTMALSTAACGEDGDKQTDGSATAPQTTQEQTNVPEGNTQTEEASIDFEDGSMGFAAIYGIPANADASELSIADYNGSKALAVKNVGGGVPYVAIDVSSLLGADVENVSKIEMTIGTEYENGKFSASSGKIAAWSGQDLVESVDAWSVYKENKNPNKAISEITETEKFVKDCGNIIIVSMNTDNGAEEGNGHATMYIDNIRFLDASGNLLKADATAAFAAPKGFVKEGRDANLLALNNPAEVEGYTASADGWAQAGLDVTVAMKEALVPGSVIEITYKADAPVWLVAVSEGNPAGDWLRVGVDENFVNQGYVAADNSAVQYTYEQLEAALGKNFTDTLVTLQCESSAAWEVYGMTIGTKSNFASLGAATEIPGYAVGAAGWAQAGIGSIPDEMKAALVPGSVIEISYKADTPVWLVAVSDGNPSGDWKRVGVDENADFKLLGSLADGKVQYTYEQLAEALGENFLETLQDLQCESSSDWEVYSMTIGRPIKQARGLTALEGFAVNGAGWAQAGVELTEEMKALFVPGCVINVNYKADAPVWLVAVSDGNPAGDWMRVGLNEETSVNLGAYTDGFVQFTYEQLAEKLGGDFLDTLVTLQCESSVDWEVYSVSVGMTE